MMPRAFRRAAADMAAHKFLHSVSVFTIALSVFIVSAFALFFYNATDFLDAWRKGVRVIAYMGAPVPEDQRKTLTDALLKLDGVDSVAFISSAAALADLKEKIGNLSSLLDGLDKNPLPDAFEITLTESWREPADIEKLVNAVAALPGVADVEYAQKWLRRFNGMYNLFKATGMVMAGVFFIATLLIIANTIRLIMYARREEIEIARVVGADEKFIKYPLFIEALVLGALGGAVGILLLYLAFYALVPNVSPGAGFAFFEMRFIPLRFAAGIVACGMGIGWLGCYLSIRKFLTY